MRRKGNKINNFTNIPDVMRELDHWVLWNKDKVPYQINGQMAKSNDPDTWTTFSNALRCLDPVKHEGIGFMFAGSGITGIDIDHCIENGQISGQAQKIIKQCNSYTEKSPSGTGIHIYVKGTIPKGFKTEIEMYNKGRYFTVTGDKLNSQNVEPQQTALDKLHKQYAKEVINNPDNPLFWGEEGNDPLLKPYKEISLQRAFDSKNGAKIKALYDGDMSDYGNDHSDADLALCNHLAFWLDKDYSRIDQSFKNSQLYREKWDRQDYKDWTINKAIAGCAQSVATAPKTATEASPMTSKSDSMLNYLNDDFQADRDKFSEYKDKETGFINLDRELGGLYPGLYVVGGISSVGKTTFVYQLADQLAEKGDHIIYFSLEQSKLELITKSLSRLTMQQSKQRNKLDAVSGVSIRSGNDSENVRRAIETYRETAQRVNVIEGNFNTTAESIRDYVEKYINDNGVRPVVIIDYLQILQGDPRLGDKQRVDSTVTELKRITRDCDITLIVISSLNRGNYLTPIDFESFKESGSIEYTCDVLWGLQLEAIHDPIFNKEGHVKEKRDLIKAAKLADTRMIELVCLKNRNGKSSFTSSFSYYPRNDIFIAQPF